MIRQEVRLLHTLVRASPPLRNMTQDVMKSVYHPLCTEFVSKECSYGGSDYALWLESAQWRRVLCWLLGTSVRKKDDFALAFFIFLAALVIN